MKNRCIIITAYVQGSLRECYAPQEGDFLLCADGGYAHAVAAGLKPHLVIGDCDSNTAVAIPETLLRRVPMEKDDTDTMLCIKYALEQKYKNILVIGGIGGRLDHTISNIQSLAWAQAKGADIKMVDAREQIFLLANGEAVIPCKEGWSLSVFAYGGVAQGVCESGVQYPLQNATMSPGFPIGVSNKIIEKEARVSVEKGLLIIIQSRLE